MKKGGGENDKI